MIQLHEKYGPVLRIAPDELSFANAQAWQDICGKCSLIVCSLSHSQFANDCIGQTFAGKTADLEKDRSFYMIAPNGVDSIVCAHPTPGMRT